MLLETPLQGVLIFFAPRALRLLGALGMGQSTANAQNSTFAIPIKNRDAKELFSCLCPLAFLYICGN